MAGTNARSKLGTSVDARREMVFVTAIVLTGIFAAASAAPAQTPAAHVQTNDQAWLSYTVGHERRAIPPPIPPSIRALGNSVLEQSAVREIQGGIAGTTVTAGAKAASAGETVIGTLDEVRAAFPGLQV